MQGSVDHGPWNPGIRSALPSRLVPLSTIFRPETSFTSVPHATEMRDLTGLPLEDLAVFRPMRLAAHELLIRITADVSVPDPEAARVDELGINFRRMAQTIFDGYIEPRAAEIDAAYAAVRRTLTTMVEAELSALLPPRAQAASRPVRSGLFGLIDRRSRPRATGTGHGGHWEAEERLLAGWRATIGAGSDPAQTAARRALARVAVAVRAKHGRWWGDRAVLAELAVGLACNDHGSSALGQLVGPWIQDACEREGYRLLASQARPLIMNVKGASAAGKSTMRPLQRRLAAELGVRWSDFALVSPDIWRKHLLDYAGLGDDYKYAGALTGHEIAIIDHKLDRYVARKATSDGIPHLLVDRFRFDSFAPDSDEAGSNLLTRFGHSIYMFFMITPPHETVERAWKRGLDVGRFKAVDDLLAHNIEAYSGMPDLFFTWALHSDKSVHYEFLDNAVQVGQRPRTVAFGRFGEMNILDVAGILAIERYRDIDVSATSADQVYRRRERAPASPNKEFLVRCVRTIAAVNFAAQDTGAIYARFEAGLLVWVDPSGLERAMGRDDARAGLLAIMPNPGQRPPASGSGRAIRADRSRTLGEWGAIQPTPSV